MDLAVSFAFVPLQAEPLEDVPSAQPAAFDVAGLAVEKKLAVPVLLPMPQAEQITFPAVPRAVLDVAVDGLPRHPLVQQRLFGAR
jgi:hypothetical protein